MSKSIGTQPRGRLKEIPLTNGKQSQDGIKLLPVSILSLSVIVKQNNVGM